MKEKLPKVRDLLEFLIGNNILSDMAKPALEELDSSAQEEVHEIIVFSKRKQITNEAIEWLSVYNNISHSPLNIVTALNALGYLRREKQAAALELELDDSNEMQRSDQKV